MTPDFILGFPVPSHQPSLAAQMLKNDFEFYEAKASFHRERLASHPFYVVNWRNSHKEYIREYAKLRRRKNTQLSRRSHYFQRYGITPFALFWMGIEQDYKCAICKRQFTNKISRIIHIDHDHERGHVRGLLCWDCNKFLGSIKDNPQALIDYLGRLK